MGRCSARRRCPPRTKREAGVGPKGAAARISCPALEDCWMATTEGWLFHLAPEGERTLRPNEIDGFHKADHLPPARPGPAAGGGRRAAPRHLGPQRRRLRRAEIRRRAKNRSPRANRRCSCRCSRACTASWSTAPRSKLSFHLAVKARVRLLAKRTRQARRVHAHAHAEGRQPQAAAWPQPAELADEAEPADARARAAAAVSSVTGEGADVTTVSTGLVVLPHGELTSGPLTSPHGGWTSALAASPNDSPPANRISCLERLEEYPRPSGARAAGAACGRARHGDRAGVSACPARLAPRLARRRAAGRRPKKRCRRPTPRVPASEVTMIGATPEEPGAPGAEETWGVGREGAGSSSTTVLVRYYVHSGSVEAQEGTWTLGPALPGELPKAFSLAASPLAGQMTPRASACCSARRKGRQTTTGRARAQARRRLRSDRAVPVEGEAQAAAHKGEAPVRQGTRAAARAAGRSRRGSGGAGGAGQRRRRRSRTRCCTGTAPLEREPIEVPANSAESFRVLAIGASSPANAWLLAQLSGQLPGRRGGAVPPRRKPRRGTGAGSPWHSPPARAMAKRIRSLSPFTARALPRRRAVHGARRGWRRRGQLLTVTSEGVWVDGARGDLTLHAPAPRRCSSSPKAAAGAGGVELVLRSPPSARRHAAVRARTARAAARSASRAASPGPTDQAFGERVITGLPEGVSLRLEGESFKRVLALGRQRKKQPRRAVRRRLLHAHRGLAGRRRDAGRTSRSRRSCAQPPAAVAGAVPPSAARDRAAARRARRRALRAKRSRSATTGRSRATSRARAGCRKACSGPAGRAETQRAAARRRLAHAAPRLSRSATKGRCGCGAAETGLWEHDPATPLNFRGNLLGIAFDPDNPARGYAVGRDAVGQGGVLLRYGKTWTEETALPPQVQGATFTSIAFAGSEAIVAYRKQPNPQRQRVRRRPARQRRLGLAGRPGSGSGDGGRLGPAGGRGAARRRRRVRGRAAAKGAACTSAKRAGAPWQAAPTPLPGSPAGSLALFREGGALRAIVAAGGIGLSLGAQLHHAGVPAACTRRPAGSPRAGKRRCAAPDGDRLERREPRTEPGRRGRKARASTATCPTGPTRSSRC